MAKPAKKSGANGRGLEAVPSLVMVVDENMIVHELNGAARAFLGSGYRKALGKRSGEAFDCSHCQGDAGGCGSGRFCQICPIREAVTEASQHQMVVRRRTKAELGDPAASREVHLLVTATPLPSPRSLRILLVLEDISDFMALQDPAPICAYCKRVRDDQDYWAQVEVHFRRHFDLDISHGTCPECARQFYGEHLAKRPWGQSGRIATVRAG
jgi:hypothetical protein